MWFLFLACTPEAPTESAADSPTVFDPPGLLGFSNPKAKNLVIVEVDTLRADHLSAYGNPREILPLTMSRSWYTVDGMMASSSWTPLATGSVMTGLEVHHHGLLAYDGTTVQNPITAPTLGQVFQQAGYRTGLFSGNTFLTSETGIGSGFSYEEVSPQLPGVSNLGTLSKHALSWLDEDSGPFLMFLQPMDMHEPYSPEPVDRGTWAPDVVPFDEDSTRQSAELEALWLQDTPEQQRELTQILNDVYDEQALGLDRALDHLLDGLEERGVLKDTLVVFIADHGETLNDDGSGMFGHGESVRQELLKVPLFFLSPNIPAGEINCYSQGFDLLPTLLEMMELPAMEGLDGQSMQQSCRETTRASLFVPGKLWWVTMATQRERISRDCMLGVESAWNLERDPAAHVPTPPEVLPDTAILQPGLDAYVAEIAQAIPGSACTIR